MILREIESPNPVPEDFVVKNGSNIWLALLGVIPGPLSWTINETVEFALLVVTSRRALMVVRSVVIASIAFLIKFKITCCSWVGSAIICGRSS